MVHVQGVGHIHGFAYVLPEVVKPRCVPLVCRVRYVRLLPAEDGFHRLLQGRGLGPHIIGQLVQGAALERFGYPVDRHLAVRERPQEIGVPLRGQLE